MKILLKIIVIAFIVVFITLAFYRIKYSEKVLVLAQHEMLACEGCNHMFVIRSSNNDIFEKTIIPIASKSKIEEVVESALSNKEHMVCIEGRLYVIDFYFNMVDPSGTRFYVDELKGMDSCEKIDKPNKSINPISE